MSQSLSVEPDCCVEPPTNTFPTPSTTIDVGASVPFAAPLNRKGVSHAELT